MSGRIRTIKPEWLEDQRMARASPEARVLSVALLVVANDFGAGRADPLMLALQVFPPHDPTDFRTSLERFERASRELQAMRYFAFYEADGQRYFAIRNWSKHQRVQHPTASQLPEPPAGLFENRGAPPEELMRDSGEPHEELMSGSGEPTESLHPRARADRRPSTIEGKGPRACTREASPSEPERDTKPRDPLAYLGGGSPQQRPDVLDLFEAFKAALRQPKERKLRRPGYEDDDANCLAEAIDQYGLDTCLRVVRSAPRDGMVSGETDERKQAHGTIRYIFGNAEAFARILKLADGERPKQRRTMAEVIADSKNAPATVNPMTGERLGAS